MACSRLDEEGGDKIQSFTKIFLARTFVGTPWLAGDEEGGDKIHNHHGFPLSSCLPVKCGKKGGNRPGAIVREVGGEGDKEGCVWAHQWE
jgi:hypothetical protein